MQNYLPEGLDGSVSLLMVCGECKAGCPGDVACRDAGEGPITDTN